MFLLCSLRRRSRVESDSVGQKLRGNEPFSAFRKLTIVAANLRQDIEFAYETLRFACNPGGKILFGNCLRPMSNALRPDVMTAPERLDEIAQILAKGLMRLRAGQSSPLSPDLGESSLDCADRQSGYADADSLEVEA